MKLQIKKLFLVQRGTHELKAYDFEPGKLNIIVGQGARGKTTVWSIIDYVCCSNECDIDSDISNAVEWVGLQILTPLGVYVIARELKDELNAQSSVYYMKHLEADVYEVDGLEVKANSNKAAVKGLLDRICGVEAMTTQADENGQKISFSIRYLLEIVGQDYRTLSDQQRLFACQIPQQEQTVIKYFASILGVQADALNLLRAEKQSTEKELKQLKDEYKRALSVSETWKSDLSDQLLEAKKLTMIPADVAIPKDVDKCLELVKSIISEAREKPMVSYNVDLLGELAEKVTKNKERKSELEIEIEQLQVRIEELEGLEKKAEAIHKEAIRVKDRMEIAKWMAANWGECEQTFFRYPYSDGRTAEEVREEISRLNAALSQYEKTALSNDKVLQFKNLNTAEKKRLKERQTKLAKEVAELRREIEGLKNQGKSEKERIEQYESVNQRARELIGKLGKTQDLVEGLSDAGVIARKIESLKAKVDALEQKVNLEKARVEAMQKDKLEELSRRSFEIAQGVGLNESFNFANILFDADKLDFKILRADGETYLKNRKSTANHVAFHIGVTAAMQEICAGNEKSLLPDFVIYDQPTQGRSGVAGGENVGESCFVNIAKELSKSVGLSAERWQPILIDSWSRETLDKLVGVEYHLVADLDTTKGLVPVDWMKA